MFLVGCSEQNEEIRNSVIEESTETESSLIIEEETEENNVQIEPVAPTKEEVFAMREKVLDGMTDDEKERLTENIKVANLQMERAYLNDGIFDKQRVSIHFTDAFSSDSDIFNFNLYYFILLHH